MASEIKVPSVGESVSEVTIGKWLKQEGEQVAKDEVVLALETDKVNVEVTSPEAGVLRGIKKAEGDTATIGEVVATVEAGSGAGSPPAAGGTTEAPGQQARTQPAEKPTVSKTMVSAQDRGSAPAAKDGSQATGDAQAFVMPAAGRMMATEGVTPDQVQGTGPGGRVLKEDVQRAQGGAGRGAEPQASSRPAPAPAPAPSPAPQATGELEQVVRMSGLRRRIAERLVQAQQTAAILTTFNEVDMTAVMALRRAHQESFVARYGIKLGFMSFFVKAAVDALRAYPEINAEIRGTDVVYRRYYDVGVAVGGDKGLVVPVVRRAELLSFAEIEQTISAYGVKAKAGKLTLDEMTGGTFTISNGGVYGSMMSTPILNPPQSGILGMHSIIDRPVGVDGKIELRPMMYLALSYDHRIVDGKGAVSFLKRIKSCIEAPERMLLEI